MTDLAAIRTRLESWRRRVDAAIAAALPDPAHPPQRLHAAMRHAALLGGKRIRPLLVYATATSLKPALEPQSVDAAAAAVELIHAYSLVHDDLPAMDDDDLRRGQPTVHMAYDEATAILAGDALQSLAFAVLARSPLPAQTRVAMLAELAEAAGAHGMCGGQALDIASTGQAPDIAALQRLHALKTGALLRAAIRLGALAAQAGDQASSLLEQFADALGLAFQIRDDLLDIESDTATLGKTAGKDCAQNKATYPALIGIDGSKQALSQLATTMDEALHAMASEHTADVGVLRHLAHEVIRRDH